MGRWARPGEKSARTVFVPYGAPGDQVTLSILEEHRTYRRALPQTLAISSLDRVPPPCSLHFTVGKSLSQVCGGCGWQHLSLEAQRRHKQTLVAETLERIGHIPSPPVLPTRGGDAKQTWGYRRKALIPFQPGSGGARLGFFAPASHRVVPFETCPVQDPASLRLIQSVKTFFQRHPHPVAEPGNRRGWLRNLLLRTSSIGGSLVALVVNHERFALAKTFSAHLQKDCQGPLSVFLNIQNTPGNVLLSPHWKHLSGPRALEEHLLGLDLQVSPGAFMQVNTDMAKTLYTLAVDLAQVTTEDTALELYAGVGVMGLLLARQARHVWAVEENPQAVEDGRENARRNGIHAVSFHASPSDSWLKAAPWASLPPPTVVVVDPPRAGLEESVLGALAALRPRRLVYVSCNPATLARDAHRFSSQGFHLKSCQPIDLFPQTSHIETVSLFEPD